MKKIVPAILFTVSVLLSMNVVAQEAGQKIYRITVSDSKAIRDIESKTITVVDSKPGSYIDILAFPDQVRLLNIPGAEVECIADSFSERYPLEATLKSAPFHGYIGTMNALDDFASRFPSITRLDTIGFSVQGRAICSLKISDNPGSDEDETPILIAGAHHGNEVHSIEATLHQINYLLENYGVDPEVTFWINNMEIWFVPLVNPDGREAMRRANTNNVDLNRNYSFGFTPGGTHGPEAFSEPETRAIRDLTAAYPPVMSLSYHTSGQYVLLPWTHTDEAAPDSLALLYVGDLVSRSILIPNGHYTLLQGGRWYFTAGEYCDYLYSTHNTLAFTVEMGTSQAADYSVVPEMVERNLQGMKTLFRQSWKAGVTGRVYDRANGMLLRASIDLPEIDRQGKIPIRVTDSLYGRYHRYLQPGTYLFEVSSPGYESVSREITVTADSLVVWDIALDRIVSVDNGAKPSQTILYDCAPNPVTNGTIISFSLEQPGPVEIEIISLSGSRVKTLLAGEFGSGMHQVVWDRTDRAGQTVPAGIYLYRLRSGQYSQVKQLVVTGN